MTKVNFQQKRMAAVIAAYCLSGSAMAQTGDTVDEIIVSGIRASLTNAMDIKRDAVGVVDAISAEDIGKMPDTNLAESLQRITGVSISRINGEGSQVTVRGIRADLNMVTLNGRNMPAVANGGIADQATRAFDFSNIASEGISGTEIYKTGRADITTGGLGGTINVKTLRPLDVNGTKATIGIKGVQDTTVRETEGDKYTPEISGLYSWSNDDQVFGVAITGSYQKRNNMRSNAFISQWTLNKPYSSTANVVNAPQAGDLYNLPSDIRYSLEDNERVRKNGQLTLQYHPTQRLTATLDYTFSENKLSAERAQQSIWFDPGHITDMTFDDRIVKTPIIYKESYNGYNDIAFAKQIYGAVTQNHSLGANLEFEVSDDFTLTLDWHNSSAENRPTLRNGATQTEAGMAAEVITGKTGLFDRDLPVMGMTINDALTTDGGGHPWKNGNANGVLDAGDMTGTIGTMDYSWQRTTIEQTRAGGQYHLGDSDFFKSSEIDFGLETRTDTNYTRTLQAQRVTMGNWGGVNPDKFPDNFFTPRDFAKAFPDYGDSTRDPAFIHQGIDGDAWGVLDRAEYLNSLGNDPDNFNSFVNGKAKWNGTYDLNRIIEEKVDSAFVQFKTEFDIGSMPSHLLAGVRYEKTETTSTSMAPPVTALRQDGDNDWTVILGSNATKDTRGGDYTNVLPSFDVDMGLTESLKARFSASKTIGRASYNELRSNITINGGNAYAKTATAGNPALKPMESTNLDLSLEWYYDTSSYVSVGLFSKDVKNFIGTAVISSNWYGLRDHRAGPRYAQALAALDAAGKPRTEQNIYEAMAVVDGNDPTNPNTKIFANSSDPLMQFSTTIPVNDRDAKITGAEFAIQHLFGESGFGVQANYTKVDSDVDFDVTLTTGQFAMVGLGDSANLVAFYDKDGLQARVAYNWRDKFLDNRNQFINEPSFTAAFGQIDISASYDFSENLTFTLEGLNVTGENSRRYGRTEVQMWSMEDLGARYMIGGRYTF